MKLSDRKRNIKWLEIQLVLRKMEVKVRFYSGYKGEQRPVTWVHRGETRHVTEILSRWIEQRLQPGEGNKRYFRVRADDNQHYLLCFDDRTLEWFLEEIAISRP